ncbi:MAG: PilZ domain-containing protein [Acidimicrobiales bacterium]
MRQRFSYFGSLFAYGAGASRLAMIWLLVAVLVAGVLRARMSLLSLAVLWAPWTILAVTTATALCRGHLRTGESSHYTLVTAAIFTRAQRCALVPSRTKFKVTPKSGAGAGGLPSLARLKLVAVSALALACGLVWRGLGVLGYVHARSLPACAATSAMLLGTWELYRIVQSLRIVFRRRQRREQVRFGCLAPAAIADSGREHSYGRVVDVSLSGIGLLVSAAIEKGSLLHLESALPGLDGKTLHVAGTVVVKSARPDPSGGWRLGTTIVEMGACSRDNLVTYCYVVHPCQRLRMSRLEAPAQPAASPIPMAQPESAQAIEASGVSRIERPAAG